MAATLIGRRLGQRCSPDASSQTGALGIYAVMKSRTYSPVMRSADLPDTKIPWWNGRPLRLQFA